MTTLPITRGLAVMLDDDDFIVMSQWKWQAFIRAGIQYAARTTWEGSGVKRKYILMHRQITDAPKGMVVDHIDSNGLNNQRSNLRLCTHQQNCANRTVRGLFTSKYLGVHLNRRTGKWAARITRDGRAISLGYYDNEWDAAVAYNNAAEFYHGSYAKLNTILTKEEQ